MKSFTSLLLSSAASLSAPDPTTQHPPPTRLPHTATSPPSENGRRLLIFSPAHSTCAFAISHLPPPPLLVLSLSRHLPSSSHPTHRYRSTALLHGQRHFSSQKQRANRSIIVKARVSTHSFTHLLFHPGTFFSSPHSSSTGHSSASLLRCTPLKGERGRNRKGWMEREERNIATLFSLSSFPPFPLPPLPATAPLSLLRPSIRPIQNTGYQGDALHLPLLPPRSPPSPFPWLPLSPFLPHSALHSHLGTPPRPHKRPWG